MEATTIAALVLVALFLVGMTAVMIVRNTPPKDEPKDKARQG